jgi:hypothetical protein
MALKERITPERFIPTEKGTTIWVHQTLRQLNKMNNPYLKFLYSSRIFKAFQLLKSLLIFRIAYKLHPIEYRINPHVFGYKVKNKP